MPRKAVEMDRQLALQENMEAQQELRESLGGWDVETAMGWNHQRMLFVTEIRGKNGEKQIKCFLGGEVSVGEIKCEIMMICDVCMLLLLFPPIMSIWLWYTLIMCSRRRGVLMYFICK